MLRVIREVSPKWIVGENVFGIVNWSGGLVFEEVQADLEREGYEVQSYILPAAGVDAPHKRDRVWFVAYNIGKGLQRSEYAKEGGNDTDRIFGNRPTGGEIRSKASNFGNEWPAQNSNEDGRGGNEWEGESCIGQLRNAGTGDNERIPSDNGEVGIVTNAQNNHDDEQGGEIVSGGEIIGRRETEVWAESSRYGDNGDASNSSHTRLQRSEEFGSIGGCREKSHEQPSRCFFSRWQNFPTQSPLRRGDDGISGKLAMFVVKEVKDEISKTSKENRIQDLQEVWERVSQEEIWEKIRGLYSLESKDLLFQTMQLYSTNTHEQVLLSPFSQEVSEKPLRTLRKYGEFRSSPQGQKLEKQRTNQFGNTLSFLPHEVALAARAYTNSIRKFESWHRNEAIKAYGNAVVPQVVLQIFKAIQAYEDSI